MYYMRAYACMTRTCVRIYVSQYVCTCDICTFAATEWQNCVRKSSMQAQYLRMWDTVAWHTYIRMRAVICKESTYTCASNMYTHLCVCMYVIPQDAVVNTRLLRITLYIYIHVTCTYKYLHLMSQVAMVENSWQKFIYIYICIYIYTHMSHVHTCTSSINVSGCYRWG